MRNRGNKKQKKSTSRTKTIFKVKSMFDCSGNVDPNSIINCYVPRSSKVVNSGKVNDVRDSNSATKECCDQEKEVFGMKNDDDLDHEKVLLLGWKIGRSYSMGVGKIGRIDEDLPCDFKEVDVKRYFYPRCRSFAFAKQNLVH